MAKKRAADTPEEAGSEGVRVNKSKAVREYKKAHPKAKPMAIARALQEKGLDIEAGYVSTVLSQSKKRRQAVREVVEKRGVGIPEIKLALSLLKLCDGMAGAREALAAAEDIRKAI